MTMAAVALVFGVSSCGGDDDVPPVPESPVADLLAGSYSGTETMTVSGDIDESEKVFQFTKANNIAGALPLGSYTGTVKNAKGEEKTYVVSDFMVLYDSKKNDIMVTFKLKYGNMPFDFDGVFTGKKLLK